MQPSKQYAEFIEILNIFVNNMNVITTSINNNNILRCNEIDVVSDDWCVCAEMVSVNVISKKWCGKKKNIPNCISSI